MNNYINIKYTPNLYMKIINLGFIICTLNACCKQMGALNSLLS